MRHFFLSDSCWRFLAIVSFFSFFLLCSFFFFLVFFFSFSFFWLGFFCFFFSLFDSFNFLLFFFAPPPFPPAPHLPGLIFPVPPRPFLLSYSLPLNLVSSGFSKGAKGVWCFGIFLFFCFFPHWVLLNVTPPPHFPNWSFPLLRP